MPPPQKAAPAIEPHRSEEIELDWKNRAESGCCSLAPAGGCGPRQRVARAMGTAATALRRVMGTGTDPTGARGSRAGQGRMEEPSSQRWHRRMEGSRPLLLPLSGSQGLQEGCSGLTAPSPMLVLQTPRGVLVSSQLQGWDVAAPASGCSQEKTGKIPTNCSLCPSLRPLSRCCKFSLVFCNLMICSQEKISLQFTKTSLLI